MKRLRDFFYVLIGKLPYIIYLHRHVLKNMKIP